MHSRTASMVSFVISRGAKCRALSQVSLALVAILLIPFSSILPASSSFAESPLQTYCDSLPAGAKDNPASAKDNTVCKDYAADPEGNVLSSDGILMKTINILSILTGAMAVIFLIVGGIQIASSRGDSDKVKKARERIIYALVGVVVLILSNLIIRLILSIINKVNSTA